MHFTTQVQPDDVNSATNVGVVKHAHHTHHTPKTKTSPHSRGGGGGGRRTSASDVGVARGGRGRRASATLPGAAADVDDGEYLEMGSPDEISIV